MNANDLIVALGAEFFTGVPDSKLRPLVDALMDTYGANSPSARGRKQCSGRDA